MTTTTMVMMIKTLILVHYDHSVNDDNDAINIRTGGLAYNNEKDAHHKFLKNALKGTRITYDHECGSNGILPLRGANSKTCHILS